MTAFIPITHFAKQQTKHTMKKHTPLLLLAAAFVLLASRCKKDSDPPPPQLPAATQQGLNTIGFKVNGEVWTPYYECKLSGDPCGKISARYGPPNADFNQFDMQVARTIDQRSSLTITTIGRIKNIGNHYDSTNFYFLRNGSTYRNLPFLKSDKLEVTKLDTLNKIISGTFELTVYKSGNIADSLKITEGRFDFKYNACICD
jgi:hypothetical protein